MKHTDPSCRVVDRRILDRAPFVGVGPGRCGTKTLQMVVNGCDNASVTHERYHSRWYHNDSALDDLVRAMRKNRDVGVLVGEVQCQLMSHVPYLRSSIPDLKVVCLHREKQAVVDSYTKSFRPMFRPMDKGMNYPEDSPWPGRYPIIDAATSRQAFEFWWEMCAEFMANMPEPCLHMDIEGFNTDEGLTRLFEFLEIPEDDRVYPEVRRHNTTEQRSSMTIEEHLAEAGLLTE